MSKYTYNQTTYDIEIDGSALTVTTPLGVNTSATIDFEERIKKILDAIVARKVAQQVFSSLPKGKPVKIVPRSVSAGRPLKYTPDFCNAEEMPTLEGVNLASMIRIDPLTWKPGGDCNPTGSAGSDADEMLLHEILHSYRQLSGKVRSEAFNVAPDKQYDTIEDFWAIVVTNIYMSEKGKTLLRQDHQNYASLPPKWSTSAGFLSDRDLRRWSRNILKEEEPLLKAIDSSIASTTRFNPFHELLHNPTKYIDLDTLEGARDVGGPKI
jgi:hypothetical protein